MQENNHESNSNGQDNPEHKDSSTQQKEGEIKSLTSTHLPAQPLSASFSLPSSKDQKPNLSKSIPNQDEFVPNVLKVHGYLEVLGIVTPTDDNVTKGTIELSDQKSNDYGSLQIDNGTLDKRTLQMDDTQPVLTLDNFCGELKIDGDGLHNAVRKIQSLNATADVAPHDGSIHETRKPSSSKKPPVVKDSSKEKPQDAVKSSPSLATQPSTNASSKTRPQPKQSGHQTASTPKHQNQLVKKASKHVSSNQDVRKDTARDAKPAASPLILSSSQSLRNEKKQAALPKKKELMPLSKQKKDSPTLSNTALPHESPVKTEKSKGDSETQQDETKNVKAKMSDLSVKQDKNDLPKHPVVQSKDVHKSQSIKENIVDGSGKPLDNEPSTQPPITETEGNTVTYQSSGSDDPVETAAHTLNAQSHSEYRVDDLPAKEASKHNSTVIDMPTPGQATQTNAQESIHDTQSNPTIASSAFPQDSTRDDPPEGLSNHSPPPKNEEMINHDVKNDPTILEKTQQNDKDPPTATPGSQEGSIKKSQETSGKETKPYPSKNNLTAQVENVVPKSPRKKTGLSNTTAVTSRISKFPVPLHAQKVNNVPGPPRNTKTPTDVKAVTHSPPEVDQTKEQPLKDTRLKGNETTPKLKKGKTSSTSKTKDSTAVSKVFKDGVQRTNPQEKTLPPKISHNPRAVSPSPKEVKTTQKKPSVTHEAGLNKTQVIRSSEIASPDENSPEKQLQNSTSKESTVKDQPEKINSISKSPSLKSLQADQKLHQTMKLTAVEDQTMKPLSSTDTDPKETHISSDIVGRENSLINNIDVVTSPHPENKQLASPTEAEIHHDINNPHGEAAVHPMEKDVKMEDETGKQVGTIHQPDNVALDTQTLTTDNEEPVKSAHPQTTKEQQVGETVTPSDSSPTEPLETSPTKSQANNPLKVSVQKTKVDDAHGGSSSNTKKPTLSSDSGKRVPNSRVPSRSIPSGGSIKKAARKDKHNPPVSSMSTLRFNAPKSTSLKSVPSQATVKKQELHNKDGKASLDIKPNESVFNLDKRTANMKNNSPKSNHVASSKNSGHIKKNVLMTPISFQTRKVVKKNITQQKFKSPGKITHENSAGSSVALREPKLSGDEYSPVTKVSESATSANGQTHESNVPGEKKDKKTLSPEGIHKTCSLPSVYPESENEENSARKTFGNEMGITRRHTYQDLLQPRNLQSIVANHVGLDYFDSSTPQIVEKGVDGKKNENKTGGVKKNEDQLSSTLKADHSKTHSAENSKTPKAKKKNSLSNDLENFLGNEQQNQKRTVEDSLKNDPTKSKTPSFKEATLPSKTKLLPKKDNGTSHKTTSSKLNSGDSERKLSVTNDLHQNDSLKDTDSSGKTKLTIPPHSKPSGEHQPPKTPQNSVISPSDASSLSVKKTSTKSTEQTKRTSLSKTLKSDSADGRLADLNRPPESADEMVNPMATQSLSLKKKKKKKKDAKNDQTEDAVPAGEKKKNDTDKGLEKTIPQETEADSTKTTTKNNKTKKVQPLTIDEPKIKPNGLHNDDAMVREKKSSEPNNLKSKTKNDIAKQPPMNNTSPETQVKPDTVKKGEKKDAVEKKEKTKSEMNPTSAIKNSLKTNLNPKLEPGVMEQKGLAEKKEIKRPPNPIMRGKGHSFSQQHPLSTKNSSLSQSNTQQSLRHIVPKSKISTIPFIGVTMDTVENTTASEAVNPLTTEKKNSKDKNENQVSTTDIKHRITKNISDIHLPFKGSSSIRLSRLNTSHQPNHDLFRDILTPQPEKQGVHPSESREKENKETDVPPGSKKISSSMTTASILPSEEVVKNNTKEKNQTLPNENVASNSLTRVPITINESFDQQEGISGLSDTSLPKGSKRNADPMKFPKDTLPTPLGANETSQKREQELKQFDDKSANEFNSVRILSLNKDANETNVMNPIASQNMNYKVIEDSDHDGKIERMDYIPNLKFDEYQLSNRLVITPHENNFIYKALHPSLQYQDAASNAVVKKKQDSLRRKEHKEPGLNYFPTAKHFETANELIDQELSRRLRPSQENHPINTSTLDKESHPIGSNLFNCCRLNFPTNPCFFISNSDENLSPNPSGNQKNQKTKETGSVSVNPFSGQQSLPQSQRESSKKYIPPYITYVASEPLVVTAHYTRKPNT